MDKPKRRRLIAIAVTCVLVLPFGSMLAGNAFRDALDTDSDQPINMGAYRTARVLYTVAWMSPLAWYFLPQRFEDLDRDLHYQYRVAAFI